jgi:hypothetical protein
LSPQLLTHKIAVNRIVYGCDVHIAYDSYIVMHMDIIEIMYRVVAGAKIGSWSLFLTCSLISGNLWADLRSTTGSLQFDINKDASMDMVLSSGGLGLGTASPQAALHVAGEANFRNGNVGISGNLIVQGHVSYGVQRLTSAGNIGGHSMVLAQSDNAMTINLPEANAYTFKQFTVKNIGSGNVIVSSSSNIDGYNLGVHLAGAGHRAYAELYSNGEQWLVLSRSESGYSHGPEGLVGWWKLDDAPGSSTAVDCSKNRYHGTHTHLSTSDNVGLGGVARGQCVSYDGVDDYTALPALNLNSNTVTITAWVWIHPSEPLADSDGIVFCRSGSTVSGLRGGGTLKYHWNDQYYGWNSGLTLSKSTWHFVAMAISPTQALLCVDDQTAVNVNNHVAEAFDGETRIGMHNYSSSYIPAKIDDVRIYNRTLSVSELNELYQERP